MKIPFVKRPIARSTIATRWLISALTVVAQILLDNAEQTTGWRRVLLGQTTVEEVVRVTQQDEIMAETDI